MIATRNKKIIAIIGLVIFVIILIWVIILGFTANTTQPNDEAYEPVSGLTDPEDKLLNATTSEDFYNIQFRFMELLEAKEKNISSTVTVQDIYTPVRDFGPVKITVLIPELSDQPIVAEVDYYAEPEPTFAIPVLDYIVSLYGNSTD